MARKYTVLLPSFHLEARIPLVVEFQPIWKICASQIGSKFPQFSGWKFNKYLSCHHLVLILKTPFLVTAAFWWMWSPSSNLLMRSCATGSRRFLGSIDVVRECLFEWKFVKPSANPASRTYQNIYKKMKKHFFLSVHLKIWFTSEGFPETPVSFFGDVEIEISQSTNQNSRRRNIYLCKTKMVDDWSLLSEDASEIPTVGLPSHDIAMNKYSKSHGNKTRYGVWAS